MTGTSATAVVTDERASCDRHADAWDWTSGTRAPTRRRRSRRGWSCRRAGVSVHAEQAVAADDLRARCPARHGRPQSRTKAGTSRQAVRTPPGRPWRDSREREHFPCLARRGRCASVPWPRARRRGAASQGAVPRSSPGTRPCARRGAPRARAWAFARAGMSGATQRTDRVPSPCGWTLPFSRTKVMRRGPSRRPSSSVAPTCRPQSFSRSGGCRSSSLLASVSAGRRPAASERDDPSAPGADRFRSAWTGSVAVPPT